MHACTILLAHNCLPIYVNNISIVLWWSYDECWCFVCVWERERLCVLRDLAQNSWKTRWLQEEGSRWAMECEKAFTHKHTPLDQEDGTTDTLSRCVKLAGPIGVATASWGQHMATSTRCADPLLPPKLTLILIHTLICTFSPPNKKKNSLPNDRAQWPWKEVMDTIWVLKPLNFISIAPLHFSTERLWLLRIIMLFTLGVHQPK